jgi:GTP-binding protein
MSRARYIGSFTDTLPPPTLPEIAFAGRSNVGKSSALNTLAGVSGLARVAKTPGRTQAINLFEIDGAWIAADLPGYGYARVGHSVRDSWKGMIETYLGGRSSLLMVVALIDSRLEAQEADQQLLQGLSAAEIPTLVVATKVDAHTRNKRAAAIEALAAGHGIPAKAIVPFSAHDGTGKDAILDIIRKLLKRAAKG